MENTLNENNKDKMYILIQCKHFTITIGKDILRNLGFPTHICFRVNSASNSFIILPCKAEDAMSFKVPDDIYLNHHTIMRIRSKAFLSHIIETNNFDSELVYSYGAHFIKEKNTVLVNLLPENLRRVSTLDRMKVEMPVG